MFVKKRNDKIVPYDDRYINRAISLAAMAANEYDDKKVAAVTASVTEDLVKRGEETVFIEVIQDTVEDELFKHEMYYTMRAYIRYRITKQQERERTGGEWKDGLGEDALGDGQLVHGAARRSRMRS